MLKSGQCAATPSMNRLVASLCVVVVLWVVPTAKAQSIATRQATLEKVSNMNYGPLFATVAARLKTGIRLGDAQRQLDSLLSSEHGDMFWAIGSAGLSYACRQELVSAQKQRIRNGWKFFTPYRGDTENHFLMYYGGFFLMAQEWQNLPGTEWFNGKSSKENYDEAKAFLNEWIDSTVQRGMMEFDSPRYMYYFITPLVLLAEYTNDATLRKRFTMTLEILLADYAHDYVDGNYCGAYSRLGNDAAFDTRKAETAAYGNFYFRDNADFMMPDVAFAAIAKFSCPDIIRKIALDKTLPFSSQEIKRRRTALRYANGTPSDVYKYLYVTKEYALGSCEGGLVSPIQQRSWSLTALTPKANNVIFGLQPFSDRRELGMFFPEVPAFQLERIGAVKEGYMSEDKKIGGSPYEEIKQQGNRLHVEFHQVPAGVRYQHVDIYIPKWAKLIRGLSGGLKDAVVVQLDSCVVRIVPLTTAQWSEEQEHYRIRIPFWNGYTAYEVESISAEEHRSGKFGADIVAEPLPELRLTHDEKALFLSQHIFGARFTGHISVMHSGLERKYDFGKNTVTETRGQ